MTIQDYNPEQLVQWDRDHSWHPFTHMRQYLEGDPVIILKGEGVRVQDIHGRWFYDGCASIWLNVHGHHVPALDDAVRQQLDAIAHTTTLGQANIPATVLAKRLAEISPDGLTRAQFSDCGASAVEIAVKIAIQHWSNLGQPQRCKILGFHNNYHGDTLGAMAVAPNEVFHRPFLDLLPVNLQIPYPACADVPFVEQGASCEASVADPLRKALAASADTIAAVIIEPVEGAGSIVPAMPGYLALARSVCDEFGVLLIVDEIATGFGRTGHLFACSPEEVRPDILCLGKGLSGGYLPVAATLTTERIFQSFLGEVREGKTLFHGHSFAGNPLGCAVALANLDLLPDMIVGLPEKIDLLANALVSFENKPFVGEVRQRGLMVGIDLAAHPQDGVPFDWTLLPGYVVAECARKRGLLIRPIGNTVIFMPPPASTSDELREMTSILAEAFDAASDQLETLARQSMSQNET